MLPLLSLFVTCCSFFLKPCGSVRLQYDEGSIKRIVDKITMMQIEIVKDALSKLASVQHFRNEFYKSTPYQLGEVTCSIHNLFNKMLKIYSLSRKGLIHDGLLVGKFEECHRYWFHIDHLIQMIELWELKKAGKNKEDVFGLLGGNLEAGRRYQNLAAGDELDLEQMEEHTTTTQPTLTQAKIKRKNKLWHAASRRRFL